MEFDIIFLQETHLTEEDSVQIQKLFPNSYCNSYLSNSGGTAIIINNNEIELRNKKYSKDGRLIFLEIMFENEIYNLLNIYLPATIKERISFLKLWSNLITNKLKKKKKIILGGDFNCITSINQKHSIKKIKNKTSIKEDGRILKRIFTNLNLKHQKNNNEEFTYVSSKSKIKLDRIYSNIKFNLTSKVEQKFCKSDHFPASISITFNEKIEKGTGFWRLNSLILKDGNLVACIKRIGQLIIEEFDGSPIDKWVEYKNQVTNLLKQIQKEEKSKNLRELNAVNYQINKFTNGKWETDLERLKILEERKNNYELQNNYWIKLKYLKDFDELGSNATPFFSNLEKDNQKKKRINKIKIDSQETEGLFNCTEKIGDYFEKFFSEKKVNKNNDEFFENLPQVPKYFKTVLNNKFTNEEIKNIIKKSKNGSSPGLDGLPFEFYKIFKKTISILLSDLFNYYIDQNVIIEDMLESLISLLPKVDNPEIIQQFRPISLMNCDYKILSSALTERIHLILPQLIQSNQNAYVRGRLIFNNILNIYSVTKLSKKGYILFLDFEKAFDSINRKYMYKVLKRMGFGKTFIKLIKLMHTNTKSRILNSGFISHQFNSNNGVKQGDPISGLLFILCIETVVQKTKKHITGVTIENINIKESIFADDSSYNCLNSRDVNTVLDTQNKFEKVSGLKLNKDKSFIYSIEKTKQQKLLEIKIIDENSEKYLGFFLNNTGFINNLNNIIEKMQQKLNNWKKRFLSIEGKVLVLRTYVLSMTLFYTYFLNFNEKQLSKINEMISWFLWSKEPVFEENRNNKYYNKIARRRLYSPKLKGGLEIEDPTIRVKSQRVQMMLFSLRGNTPFWKSLITSRLTSEKKKMGNLNIMPDNYLLWGNCLGLDEGILDLIFHEFINFGFDTEIKENKWYYSNFEQPCFINKEPQENIKIFKNIRKIEENAYINQKQYEEAENFCGNLYKIEDPNIDFDSIYYFFKIPKEHKEEESKKCLLKYSMINGTKIPDIKLKHIYKTLKVQDSSLTKTQEKRKEEYSFKYEFIWSTILNLNTRTKIKELIWKIYSNTIPIGSNIKYMNPESEFCFKCKKSEDLEHCFFNCPKVRLFIKWFLTWWFEKSNEKIHAERKNWLDISNYFGKFKHIFTNLKSIAYWSIWITRNNAVFNNKVISLEHIKNSFNLEVQRYTNSKFDNVPLMVELMELDIVEWNEKYIKLISKEKLIEKKKNTIDEEKYQIIYTDGACRNNGKINAISSYGVYFNQNDHRNEGGLMPSPHTNSRGELFAILRAFQIHYQNFLNNQNTKNICFFTDSKYVITFWKKIKTRWKTTTEDEKNRIKNYDLIKTLAKWLGIFPDTWFEHVYGHTGDEGNEGADTLCNVALDLNIAGKNNSQILAQILAQQ